LLPHCSWFVHPTISHICTKTYAGTPSWWSSCRMRRFVFRQWRNVSLVTAALRWTSSSNSSQ
jgi:hypothetical protein